MKHRTAAPRALLAALAAPSALALAAASLVSGDRADAGTVAPVVTAAAPPAVAAPSPIPAADPRYRQSAEAARANDLAAARRTLTPLLAAASASPAAAAEAARARAVLGLLGWSHGRCAETHDALAAPGAPPELEDYRLWALADCAAPAADDAPAPSRERRLEAIAALEALTRTAPDSPLALAALPRLAELTWAAGDARAARGWVERARSRELASADRARLETLAWTMARATGDSAAEVDAARRLLVAAPLAASKLQVAAPLAARGVDWRSILGPEDVLRRSAALLDAGVPEGALTTLEALPATARAHDWRLLHCRALVAAGRGADALVELGGTKGPDADGTAELRLLESRAAEEAATVVRGRPHPPAEARAKLRARSNAALVAASQAARSEDLRRRALVALYGNLEADGRMEEAIAVLRDLVPLDPAGQTGARALWERGWREYRSANFTGAIGYWSELASLYPGRNQTRSAAYWTARAHEALGERVRASAAYRELAASATKDFYAQQAALRLRGAGQGRVPEPSAVETARDVWPADTRLARAGTLAALGLDRLAIDAVDRAGDAVDPRAAAALRALAWAHAGGERESLRELRKAFPRLGTAYQWSVPNEALALYYPRPYEASVRASARAQGLPPSLVFGIIHQESGFDAGALSRSGARGLMQIMPATGREVAKKLGMPFSPQRLYEPDVSLRLGTTYFRQLLGQFDDRVELALAGYNGGPGRIGRLWRAHGDASGVDLFLEDLILEESRNYVKRIVLLAESYRSLYSDLG